LVKKIRSLFLNFLITSFVNLDNRTYPVVINKEPVKMVIIITTIKDRVLYSVILIHCFFYKIYPYNSIMNISRC